MSITATINGECRTFENNLAITELLEQLRVSTKGIAVERNLEIIPHSLYDTTPISDGDAIEIIGIIGGG
ncbi:MAG: sulfur carrier protein ThiS [Hyphomicrobiales bacterium]|nr:sulfur carrier protein ThiS [Rickettsiales bacterium]MCP5361489.1 sulfur carrier protein ThiS [Hyphomicrobiales bacterium]